jgi:hypothetical protein
LFFGKLKIHNLDILMRIYFLMNIKQGQLTKVCWRGKFQATNA